MLRCWLADSLRRFYPASGAETRDRLQLRVLRGERASFQIVVRNEGEPVTVEAKVDGPEGIATRVRRVGFVPFPHINSETPASEIEGLAFLPGLVPDPLFAETSVLAGPYETNSFWVSLEVSPDADPGDYPITATVSADGEEVGRLSVAVRIGAAVLPQRRDFPVTNWFYADAIADWYGVDPFGDAFWGLTRPYLRNLVAHG